MDEFIFCSASTFKCSFPPYFAIEAKPERNQAIRHTLPKNAHGLSHHSQCMALRDVLVKLLHFHGCLFLTNGYGSLHKGIPISKIVNKCSFWVSDQDIMVPLTHSKTGLGCFWDRGLQFLLICSCFLYKHASLGKGLVNLAVFAAGILMLLITSSVITVSGWRAILNPPSCLLNQCEFDVLISAGGGRFVPEGKQPFIRPLVKVVGEFYFWFFWCSRCLINCSLGL